MKREFQHSFDSQHSQYSFKLNKIENFYEILSYLMSSMKEQFKSFLPSSVIKALIKADYDEQVAFQAYGLILQGKTKDEVVNWIQNGRVGFSSPVFDEFEKIQHEYDDFMCNPVNVVEGVVACSCGSKRTFSTQKQTRGSDEPLTTFSRCVECGKTWSYSG